MQNRAEEPKVLPGYAVLPALATDIRLVGLSLRAGLLGAGVVPWLLWLAYVSVAVGQEPPLLRNFGIHLVPEAIGLATGVLLLLLSAHVRVASRLLALLATIASLTACLALLTWLTAAGLERVRQGPYRGVVDWRSCPMFFLTFFPAAVCASLLAGRPGFGRLLHCLVQAVLAMTWVGRSTAADWPWSQVIATMACSVSAIAAAAHYCRQKS